MLLKDNLNGLEKRMYYVIPLQVAKGSQGQRTLAVELGKGTYNRSASVSAHFGDKPPVLFGNDTTREWRVREVGLKALLIVLVLLQMSKSTGNFLTLRAALDKFSADGNTGVIVVLSPHALCSVGPSS